jgi:excinuclease ABC subunit A
MVENSPLLIDKSHYTIELGPESGNGGGQIMYDGYTKKTHGDEIKNIETVKRKGSPGKGLHIAEAYANNLQNITLDIPSGIMTAITGVSGSGKTSLLDKVIFESYGSKKPVFCESISGFENFSGLIYIRQPLPGKGYNATAGDKLGISEIVSRIFADSNESKTKGYRHSHFIRGSREGRCLSCEGTGLNQVSMDFFSDMVSPCERCGGSGFRDEVLGIMIDGKNISDVLEIPFHEMPGFFNARLHGKSAVQAKTVLTLIEKTGLGHLNSGRTLKTVSTGELQRLKMVSGLLSHTAGNTLFLFDEPTGGLHRKDIEKLMLLFEELIETGNTIVCITHEPILITHASLTIELGPGGGTQGGKIIDQRSI